MASRQNKVFYLLSIFMLLVLSAYPLINGARMAQIHLAGNPLTPDEYAKYVIPYAAICLAVIIYALTEPLFSKLKKAAFPAGLALALGVFFAAGTFFENMQIYVTGMALIDTATMTAAPAGEGMTADLWQSALCAVSPDMMKQSFTYISTEGLVYVVDNSTYKIHYYIISLVLITMIAALISSIANLYRAGTGEARRAPVYLRALSVASLAAMCIFANTTAFFRSPGPVQTPLASFLTGLFFAVLGTSAGVYAGSYLLARKRNTGIWIPVTVTLAALILMYAGEAMMMGGNLYRFGTGWFYRGIPYILLSAADILIIFVSCAATYVTLGIARRRRRWPGSRTLSAGITLCILTGLAGPVIAMTAPDASDGSLYGCYVFEKDIYTSPLSSFLPAGNLPFVYGFDEDIFIYAGMGTIGIRTYDIEYYKAPVAPDELEAAIGLSGADFTVSFNLASYSERYLLAVMTHAGGEAAFALYGMDSELWLAEFRPQGGLRYIYSITATEKTTLDDLRRAVAFYEENRPVPLDEPLYLYSSGGAPVFYERQITLRDVYGLSRKGSELTVYDFDPFCCWLTGDDFSVRLYEVAGGDSVFFYTRGASAGEAAFLSRKAVSETQAIDLRRGFDALAEYLNPLRTFRSVYLIRGSSVPPQPELLFEDDYPGGAIRYYLSNLSADELYVQFDGESMPAADALRGRRLTIEDLVAGGLMGITMVPADNPLGGRFMHISGVQSFLLNDEVFYPSKSFMYGIFTERITGGEPAAEIIDYYDIAEFSDILGLYGYANEAALLQELIAAYEQFAENSLNNAQGVEEGGISGEEAASQWDGLLPSGEIVRIATGIYASSAALSRLGFDSVMLWPGNPNTPVWFTFAKPEEQSP